MRKLKCYDCGEIFDEEDADAVREKVGEFWGAPAYKNYNACPQCRSTDLEEYHENEDEGEEE